MEISTFKIVPGVRRANAFYDFSRASDGPRQKQRKFCVRVRCQSSIRTSLTQTFLLAKLLHRPIVESSATIAMGVAARGTHVAIFPHSHFCIL